MRSLAQRLAMIATLGAIAGAGCAQTNDVVATVQPDQSNAVDAGIDASTPRDAGKPRDAGMRATDASGIEGDASLQRCIDIYNEWMFLLAAESEPNCSLARLPSFFRELLIMRLSSVPAPVLNRPEERAPDTCDRMFHPNYPVAYTASDGGPPDQLCPYYCDYVMMRVTEDGKLLGQCSMSLGLSTPGSSPQQPGNSGM